MNVLFLSPEQLAALQQRNAAGDLLHQLQPALLLDGRPALNADLLLDCGPGQTWERYGELLETLTPESGQSFQPTSV